MIRLIQRSTVTAGLAVVAALALLVGAVSCAGEPDPVDPPEATEPAEANMTDAESELVRDLVSRAFEDASDFREQDGSLEDPDHPLRAWSDLLWRYGEVHRGSEAAAEAAGAALSMKGRVGEVDEMFALAGEVDPDDRLWQRADFLLYTAWDEQDFDPVIDLAEEKIGGAEDPESRAALQLLRGKTLLAAHRRDEALAALEAAASESPESRWAEEAIDLERVHSELAPGMPAQWPEVTDTKGNPVALADFAGRYLLLNFWASW